MTPDTAFEAALQQARAFVPADDIESFARAIWTARGEADARVRELCASALLNPSEYTPGRRRELAKMLVPDLHPMDDGHGQPG